MATDRLDSLSRCQLLDKKLAAGKITCKEHRLLVDVDKKAALLDDELDRVGDLAGGSWLSAIFSTKQTQQARHRRFSRELPTDSVIAQRPRRSCSLGDASQIQCSLGFELQSKKCGWAQQQRQQARDENEMARTQFYSETEEQMTCETRQALAQLAQRHSNFETNCADYSV
jgi:hypothetical protein